MDEFSDEDIQLDVESEDDTRYTITIASVSGRKIPQGEFILTLELWLKEIAEAEAERNLMGAVTQ